MKQTSHGFTLVEMLVVVSIISLLSSVTLGSLNSARIKGDNAARIRAVQEYKNALDLSYDKDGTYPPIADGTMICLGDYASDQCNAVSGNILSENPSVSTAIERYMKFRKPLKPFSIGVDLYDSPLYLYLCLPGPPFQPPICTTSLVWYLQGITECGFNITYFAYQPNTEIGMKVSAGGITVCYLFLR